MITLCDAARLVLDLAKATFDNAFSSVSTLQGLVEDQAIRLAREQTFVPSQVASVVDECVGFGRRTRHDFKHTVDRCYLLLVDLVGGEGASGGTELAGPVVGDARAPRHAAAPAAGIH